MNADPDFVVRFTAAPPKDIWWGRLLYDTSLTKHLGVPLGSIAQSDLFLYDLTEKEGLLLSQGQWQTEEFPP